MNIHKRTYFLIGAVVGIVLASLPVEWSSLTRLGLGLVIYLVVITIVRIADRE